MHMKQDRVYVNMLVYSYKKNKMAANALWNILDDAFEKYLTYHGQSNRRLTSRTTSKHNARQCDTVPNLAFGFKRNILELSMNTSDIASYVVT
jgi:hypothetical protein